MLKLEEETKSFKLDGIRVKVDVNSVGANRVNEDRWAVLWIQMQWRRSDLADQ